MNTSEKIGHALWITSTSTTCCTSTSMSGFGGDSLFVCRTVGEMLLLVKSQQNRKGKEMFACCNLNVSLTMDANYKNWLKE